MKISLDWLSDFVTWKESHPQAIARAITAGVAEVDDVEVCGLLLERCCVGEVLGVSRHPHADRLLLCDVRTDRGTKRVVCGGTNVRVGMLVAFAHVGAKVRWHGGEVVDLAKVKIRGEESEGMICAAEELGLETLFPEQPGDGERPVMDLGRWQSADDRWDIGAPLRSALGMTDTVLHVDNHAITHRADLFSHVGFARECVALGIASWKKTPDVRPPVFGKAAVPFRFLVEDKRLMPRYCACVLEIDGIGQTPLWMRRRLTATGWRPVNLPVDITNYVAMERGVPLHSFDLDDLRGDVRMRTARQGERMVTLDHQERELPEGALVLSDDDGIFDLLGIMGGLRSSTKASTRRIYLHSASLDPVAIRSTVIATGHRTDAATVYEKGVPHITAEQGFYRAVQLMKDLVPGARAVSRMVSFGTNGTAKPITLSLAYMEKVLGTRMRFPGVKKALTAIGCTVKGRRTLSVKPPLWRLRDLIGPQDIVEEVGRLTGYDRIVPVLPVASIAPPPRDHRLYAFRTALKEQGYMELLPLSLLGPGLLERSGMDPRGALRILNALGEDLSLMQPCLCPRLLEHAERSLLQCDEVLRTFTVARIFAQDGTETHALGALVARRTHPGILEEPLLQAKSAVMHALRDMGYAPRITAAAGAVHPSAHPGRSARFLVGDAEIGRVFEIHPSVRKAFDLPERAACALINLDVLFALAPAPHIAQSLPQFPAVTYDVTFTLTPRMSAEDLISRIRNISPLLVSAEIVDLYRGAPLAHDQYSVTIRCTYRSDERTLTEEEVKREHAKVEAMAGDMRAM